MARTPDTRKAPDRPDPVGSDSGGVRAERPVIVAVLLAVVAVLSAVIEVMLVPLYVGTVVVPISVVLAVLSNLALPALAQRAGSRAPLTALPVVIWVIVVLLASQAGPGGDVLLPGSGSLEWVSYGLMLGGLLAGVISVSVGEIRAARG